MQPRDLALLQVLSEPAISPDGALAAVAVRRADLDADAYRGEIWVVPTDGSVPARRFTQGPLDSHPRFSPDGRQLAFLRAEDGGKPQLHVAPVHGGEPRQVCAHPLGAAQPAWSPDGHRIAYVARVPEAGRYGTDPDVPPEREPPRRITTLRYRLDNVGFTVDRPQHLFVVDPDADDPAPVQLTDGDADHADPCWAPDGSGIAVSAARHATRHRDVISDIWLVPAGGGEPRRLTDTSMPASRPAFTPDGSQLCFAGTGAPDAIGRPAGLWVVGLDGAQPPRRVSDPELDDTDDFLAPSSRPLLVDDDGAITTMRLVRGAVQLARWAPDGGPATPIVDGPRQVQGYARAGGVTVAVVVQGDVPGELVALDGMGERTLTGFGAALAATGLRPMEELTGTSDDGYPVHGWLIVPPGDGPFPLLVNVHGGPFTQYGHTLFDEAQVYAGAGYAVLLGNPRGSAGYGQAHGRVIVGALGDRDAADVLALTERACADPRIDAGRIGLMGGSYGGFMATWLAAHHGDRFRAVISERAVNAWDSFLGSSDIGWWFDYTGDAGRLPQSPLAHADAITVPMLLIHSEQDWRCPVEQAQRLFVALKLRGAEVELLLFPGEGHELTRSGLPSHRLARFEAVLAWWDRHLG
jgi:dipeptidyl aminopeptidase/acylaminoacyl peptidase